MVYSDAYWSDFPVTIKHANMLQHNERKNTQLMQKRLLEKEASTLRYISIIAVDLQSNFQKNEAHALVFESFPGRETREIGDSF